MSSGHLQAAREEWPANPTTSPLGFESILLRSGLMPETASEPECFTDLNLDQAIAATVAGRDEEYHLTPFFHVPLTALSDVVYRHEVFRDLENTAVRKATTEFGELMHRVRSYLTLANKQHYRYEQERWFLDAASEYGRGVSELRDTLGGTDISSDGLTALLRYLDDYTASPAFTSLRSDADDALRALGQIEYALRINGSRVTVSRYESESDYSREIEELFARFRQGEVESQLLKVTDPGSMDHVEAQISQLVARLFPHEFEPLDRFCETHRGFIDSTVGRFDREFQFYLAVVEQMESVSHGDLKCCYPELSSESKAELIEGGFDLALAAKLRGGAAVVPNDYRLDDAERILVVTGPNQGGKTTFARMFGQLHYLATLGVPVPARRAQLFFTDRVFTHFEREEVAGSLRGKLEDELIRVRDVLDMATDSSIVVMNEIFSSATVSDALDLGTDVLSQLTELDCLAVCVTFIDELSRLGPQTVSLVAAVSPSDPAERTFRIARRVADGRAYAWAIAKKYDLSYEQLRERLLR